MKLIYVVIDGMSDLPLDELDNRTPLDAASTPNMDFLAETGKTGLMYTVGRGLAPESDIAVVSILGYDPFTSETSRGVLEAIGAGLSFSPGDLALRCNFATIGSQNDIIDRRVGRTLTTTEATELATALNQQIHLESYPATFTFQATLAHRGVLLLRSRQQRLSDNITNTDPAYTRVQGIGVADPDPQLILKESKPLDVSEEATISAKLVNEFTQKSISVLNHHRINERRAKRGKRKANVILSRDAGARSPALLPLNQKYNVSFVCLADMPVERGISKLAGMHMVPLPFPSMNLRRDCKLRVERLLETLSKHDCFYIHIKGPDEPGHDGDFHRKLHLIEIIDEFFIGNLLRKIETSECIICVTADHSTPCKLRAHSDDPVPVLITGNQIKEDAVSRFSEKLCENGELGIFERGTKLLPTLMEYFTQSATARPPF